MSEANNYYIGSRGIMKSCDYYSSTPHSSIKQVINYPPFIKKTNTSITTIYICSSAIPHFIHTLFKQIEFQFILVSGDCDETIPYDIFKSKEDFTKFIDNPKIIHWFSQNWVGNHSKVSLIPIGLDYHTMATRQIYWGPITSPEDQEKLLTSIKSKSKPFYEYYFEPTGKRSIIFFQFLHADFKQGMKIKKILEWCMTLLSFTIFICLAISIYSFFMKKKYTQVFYVVIAVFILSLDNSLDVLSNQIMNQKQFISI